jgi:hypothetical protein
MPMARTCFYAARQGRDAVKSAVEKASRDACWPLKRPPPPSFSVKSATPKKIQRAASTKILKERDVLYFLLSFSRIQDMLCNESFYTPTIPPVKC